MQFRNANKIPRKQLIYTHSSCCSTGCGQETGSLFNGMWHCGTAAPLKNGTRCLITTSSLTSIAFPTVPLPVPPPARTLLSTEGERKGRGFPHTKRDPENDRRDGGNPAPPLSPGAFPQAAFPPVSRKRAAGRGTADSHGSGAGHALPCEHENQRPGKRPQAEAAPRITKKHRGSQPAHPTPPHMTPEC